MEGREPGVDSVYSSPRWPEVVALITGTRNELSKQMQDLADKFDKWVIPTENRLTVVEANQASHANMFGEHRVLLAQHADALALLRAQHADTLAVLRAQQLRDAAAAEAVKDAAALAQKERQLKLDWRHWAIATTFTGVLAIPAIEQLIRLLT